MIKSMTGFGRATGEIGGKVIVAEVKSLNSKQPDLSIKVPSFLKSRENDIRTLTLGTIIRGKADVIINLDDKFRKASLGINREFALNYLAELKSLAKEMSVEPANLFSEVVRHPEFLTLGREEAREATEEEWKVVAQTITKALTAFNQFRKTEGLSLEKELKERIALILELLKKVDAEDKLRFAGKKGKMKELFNSFVKAGGFDKNRFEQELIYYFEKLDITEEKVRLKTHCNYFISTLKEEDQGKKLGFIAQEIGREVNTLGAKANDASIQKMVVEMKDELEKIKEQILNIL